MAFFVPSPVTWRQDEREQCFDLPDPPHVHQPMVERAISCLLNDAPKPYDPVVARGSAAAMARIHGSTR